MEFYIGDVATARNLKTKMPMLGGFVGVDNFKIEKSQRLASGKLVSDVIANKVRVIVEFEFIKEADFNIWVGQQRLATWREIEYQEQTGSFTKVVVDFKGAYSHVRKRTNNVWVFGGVTFTFEEV